MKIFIYTHKAEEKELKNIMNKIFDELSPQDKEKAVRLLLALKL